MLVEVSLGVHETDRYQRKTKVARFPEVVADQEAQSTGIERKGVLETVPRREGGYGKVVVMRVPGGKLAVPGIQLVPEAGHDNIIMAEIEGGFAAAWSVSSGSSWSIRTGLCTLSLQASGLSCLNTILTAGFQLHQRLYARSTSPEIRSGTCEKPFLPESAKITPQ
jgi:hypothetical protein